MFKGLKKLAVAAVVAAGLAGAGQARAGEVPVVVGLDTLLEGGSNAGGITIGDKKYSGFLFSSTGSTVLSAGDVEVLFAMDGNRHDMAFMFDLTAAGGQRSDLVIQYRLDVLGPNTITRVDASFDGGPFGAGNGMSAVSMIETVSTVDGSDLVAGGPVRGTELLNLFNDGEDVGLGDTLETALDINPTRSLLFTKDILVSARPNGAMVGVSVVQQGVEQAVIPLPAAFWAAMPIFGALAGRKKLARLIPSRA